MVLGSILDWVVFRTLDLSTFSLWWLTTKSISGVANGIYTIGSYMIVPKKTIQTEEKFEMLPMNEFMLFKEQNDLLKEQNKILKEALKME